MPLFQPKNHVLLDAREEYAKHIAYYYLYPYQLEQGRIVHALIFGSAYTAPQIAETKRSREDPNFEPVDFDDDGNPY